MFTDQTETDKPFRVTNFQLGDQGTTRSLPIENLVLKEKMKLIENIFLSISNIVKSFPWQNRVKRSPGVLSELVKIKDTVGNFFTEKLVHLKQLCDFMKSNLR